MFIRRIIPVALAVLMGSALVARAQTTPPAGSAASPRIAIANPGKIFQDMEETKAVQQKLESDRKALEAQAMGKRKEIQDLTEGIKALNPSSSLYQEKNRERLQKAIEFDTWGKIQQAELARNQKMQMFGIFKKIEDAVKKVAEKKGVDLVITDQRPEITTESVENLTIDQLRGLLNQQSVLYSDGKMDITPDVIGVLNADYAAAGQAPKATTAP